jgi:hypothetical protein
MDQDLAQVTVASLLIPDSLASPPVECCFGSSPIQAANSRPFMEGRSVSTAL